ncbi:helicase-like transcription factor CHR28 [Tanacetum coccineum]
MDPPEDAVVTTCEHVFCNQCILERLSSSDCECPSSGCKALLDPSLVFSRSALAQSDSDQNMYDCSSEPLDHCSSNVSVKAEPLGHGSSNVTVKSEPLDYYISNDAVNSSKIEAEMALKSSKIKCAMEYIQSIVKPRETTMEAGSSSSVGSSVVGEKAIVFSQWTKMLDFLEACLIDSSIGFRRLDGTMSIPERDKAVKDFNRLPEVRVMIMSLKAASLGLNMVAANHVLLLDLWWNTTTEEQAIDRAHRICQTRPVKVMRLTVEETVEDRILLQYFFTSFLETKRQIVASVFGKDLEDKLGLNNSTTSAPQHVMGTGPTTLPTATQFANMAYHPTGPISYIQPAQQAPVYYPQPAHQMYYSPAQQQLCPSQVCGPAQLTPSQAGPTTVQQALPQIILPAPTVLIIWSVQSLLLGCHSDFGADFF